MTIGKLKESLFSNLTRLFQNSVLLPLKLFSKTTKTEFLKRDCFQPFKRQSHKMVKHTHRQIADESFECV